MKLTDRLEKILPLVEKPGRYIGGELNSIIKDEKDVSLKFGFAFPDTYEIGMSYTGLQIVYKVLNDIDFVQCERVFAPALDMEEIMRREGLPLFTLETKEPLKELDILGFTLQYELSFTNVLNMLDLAGIPMRSKDRTMADPFVVGGGPCAFNPEPVAEFFDFFMLGDGEEALEAICEAYKEWKEGVASKGSEDRSGEGEKLVDLSKVDRNSFMSTIKDLPGIYVPGDEKTPPMPVRKHIVKDLDQASYPTKPIVPIIEVVHDRAVMEIFRGCTRGCRFCQAGMIYRPVRERSKETNIKLIKEQLASTGHDELSLLSLSTGDYSEFEEMATELLAMGKEANVAISLPSLRLDGFSFKVLDEIQGYKKTGLTFAPEAGSQRLRDVINKNITHEDILRTMKQAIELGWTGAKLYFMIGLPTETYEDLDGIVNVASEIMGLARGRRFRLTVSVSNFVPKPHTPFQWVAQDSPETFREKHIYLKERLRKVRGVQFNYHDSGTAEIEAVLARGDRQLWPAIYRAWELGCKFDGWREHFDYDKWQTAFADVGIDPKYYTSGEVCKGRELPWSHIDTGVTEEYLLLEWKRAIKATTTDDCRIACTNCGLRSVCYEPVSS